MNLVTTLMGYARARRSGCTDASIQGMCWGCVAGRSLSVLASWPREVPVFESGAACARFAGRGLRPASAANAERGANNDEMAAFQNCNGRRAGDPRYLRA